jgi:hypothetical protein
MSADKRVMVTKLKPGVGKIWLYLLAGGMWSAVGVILVRLGLSWIIPLEILSAVLIALVGFTLALPIYRLGFYSFAQNNINRIAEVASEKVCVFAFQAWTSYPLVVLMISLGVFLRKYSPVPKPLLAVMYIGIGFGLFLASLHYHVRSIRMFRLLDEQK